MPRLILELEGNIDTDGLEDRDITTAEIAVSNIASRVYWPGLNEWDLNKEKTAFLDRFNDQPCMPLGTANTPPANLTPSIANFADGHPAYNITTDALALVKDGFDTSGSFTVAAVVGAEIGIGSKTAGTGLWFLASLAGRIRYKIGNIERANYDSYTGPLLNSTKMTAVVFIFNRVTGQMILRVNKTLVDVMTVEALKIVEIKKELVFGRTNAGTPAGRYGAYRICMGFTKALQGAELDALETMLMESVH